jgi:large subunit ribosomal protein L29
MKKNEIKKLTKSQAINNIEKLKKDLYNIRFQKVNSQVTNTSKINETKKTIAKLKTLLKGKLNA